MVFTIQDSELEQAVGNVCMLCKRQFGNEDTLKKHQEKSDLHKHNLEIARQQKIAELRQQALQKLQEERQKYAQTWEAIIPEPQHHEKKKKKKHKPAEPKPTVSGGDLNEKNIGSKLLEKMG